MAWNLSFSSSASSILEIKNRQVSGEGRRKDTIGKEPPVRVSRKAEWLVIQFHSTEKGKFLTDPESL